MGIILQQVSHEILITLDVGVQLLMLINPKYSEYSSITRIQYEYTTRHRYSSIFISQPTLNYVLRTAVHKYEYRYRTTASIITTRIVHASCF